VPNTLKLEIGPGTAKLLIRIVKRYLLRYEHELEPNDQLALYNLLEPVVDFVERPPIRVKLKYEKVSEKDDESVKEEEGR